MIKQRYQRPTRCVHRQQVQLFLSVCECYHMLDKIISANPRLHASQSFLFARPRRDPIQQVTMKILLAVCLAVLLIFQAAQSRVILSNGFGSRKDCNDDIFKSGGVRKCKKLANFIHNKAYEQKT